jgi:hypothetical protein
MEPIPSHSRDELERAPAQGFQSESAEHAAAEPPVPATPTASGPEAAYQHEDDERI